MPDEQLAGQDTPVVDNEAQNLDPAQEQAGTTDAQTGGAEGGKESQAERTFTQKEVDAIVAREKAREARRALRVVQQGQTQHPQQPEGQEQQGKDIPEEVIEAYLAKKRTAEAVSTFTEKAEDATEKYPDYMRVVTDPRVPFSEEMIEFFAESDVGVDLAYELAKDPEKVTAIRRMSPLKAGRELARLEGELKAKPKANPSKAPEPIRPVGTRGAPSSSALPSDEDDIATWMAKERKRTRGG